MTAARVSRRTFLRSAALAAGTVAAARTSGRAADAPAAPTRPNIVFLLTDDHRWDALGCMGNPVIRTPNVDALAAAGVVFSNMFVTTSICCTSRASIFTGQYARRHGVHGFNTPFTPEQFADTYHQVLRRAGYHVGFIGKYGVGDNAPPSPEAFDYWKGFPGQGHYWPKDLGREVHLTDLMAEQAAEFLRAAPAGRPFCLSVSFKAPHCQDGDPRQFLYAPKYENLYADVAVPVPPTADPKYFEALPDYVRESEARRRWQIRFSSPDLYQQMVKGYFRLVTGVDDAVATIVAALKEKGAAGSTVIILTGDNGFYLGEHGLAGKWFMHEESIRVPLVVYDPRLPASLRGRRRREMALNIDLAPTMLALAGAAVPPRTQGCDLGPLLRGQSPAWREDWFYEHLFPNRIIPKSEGVRTRRWSYWTYLEQDHQAEWLYDIENDPRQVRNLAADPASASVLADLRGRVARCREELK